jgi:HAMP domain-containing protein
MRNRVSDAHPRFFTPPQPARITSNKLGSKTGHSLFLSINAGDLELYMSGTSFESSVYDEIIGNVVLAFILVLFIGLIAAAVFAQKIAKPIRILTHNTRQMAQFKEVPPFNARKDEIGQLAKDVYLMHHNLKDTISQLEVWRKVPGIFSRCTLRVSSMPSLRLSAAHLTSLSTETRWQSISM